MAVIACNLPQGSILRPFLFLIYVNDLPSTPDKVEPVKLADDTNLFYFHQNIHFF